MPRMSAGILARTVSQRAASLCPSSPDPVSRTGCSRAYVVLRPIFRDREDFAAGHSLTELTIAALEASQFLIVICSPHAAQSQYVNEEVRRFKAMGRAEKVLALIVEGRPDDPERECFPRALRY